MESRKFDAFVRALGYGGSRRTILKALLGVGGAATVATLVPENSDAARRPTPTPKPISCSAGQYWNGAACVCYSGTTCGPVCCHPELSGPDHSECCDGACCYGHCYGEELCCAWPGHYCAEGRECCSEAATCCGSLGCLELSEGQCCSNDACPPNSICNLDRFECECVSGYIYCGAGCIPGNCCNNQACTPGVCYENACCTPATCASLPVECGANLDDGCGGTINCNCPGTQVCYQGECCTPLTCEELEGQCGGALGNGCGGTISCSCSGDYVCEDGVCVPDPNSCDNDPGFCNGGSCALGVDGNLYKVNVTAVEGGVCGICFSNDQCLTEYGFPYCLRDRRWTDGNGDDHCGRCPDGSGGGACGGWV